MRALVVDHPGDLADPTLLRVADLPTPEPGPTEVRVRVTAAGINPVDWKTLPTGDGDGGSTEMPKRLGWDVCGVVDALGLGVTRFAVGDTVIGMPWFPREAGAFAEYVTAPSRHFAHKPEGLSDEEAAGLPLAGITAWQALVDCVSVSAGQRVLIHAAAGGVGHIAVQIARSRGAHVLGTARAAKHTFLRELGIDETIDYTATPFEQVAKDLDGVLDCVGGETGFRSVGCVRDGGWIVSIGRPDPRTIEAGRERGIRVVHMVVEPDHVALEGLADLVKSGQLRVAVDRVFPLERGREAMELGATNQTQGKLVLSIQ